MDAGMHVHKEAPDGLGTLFSLAFWKQDLSHKSSKEHNYLVKRKKILKQNFLSVFPPN